MIRNPERVKNSETPSQPPGTAAASWWYQSTASTATPRNPSSAGVRAMRALVVSTAAILRPAGGRLLPGP